MLVIRRSLPALCRIALVAASTALAPLAHSFPPAPYYTLYGDVRDQFGNMLPPGDAYVIIYSGNKEVLRQTLTNPNRADHNYQIRLRLDMQTASGSYSSIALNPGGVFTIAIEVGGEVFFPIQIDHIPEIGNPADRIRFNLTLGIDSDDDGLPDAWEESQLHLAGHQPGENGWDLSLIDSESDFNGNGISNWAEYTAGTYADDTTTTLELALKEIAAEYVRLEFYAIYGRIYSLETSKDLETWTPVPFAYSPEERETATTTTLRSETTGVVSVYADASNSEYFFRLVSR